MKKTFLFLFLHSLVNVSPNIEKAFRYIVSSFLWAPILYCAVVLSS